MQAFVSSTHVNNGPSIFLQLRNPPLSFWFHDVLPWLERQWCLNGTSSIQPKGRNLRRNISLHQFEVVAFQTRCRMSCCPVIVHFILFSFQLLAMIMGSIFPEDYHTQPQHIHLEIVFAVFQNVEYYSLDSCAWRRCTTHPCIN